MNLLDHNKTMMVEQIMTLHGRSVADPLRYRRTLEQMRGYALATLLNALMEDHDEEALAAFLNPLPAHLDATSQLQADKAAPLEHGAFAQDNFGGGQ
jgi:hypothetical protein